MKFQIPDELIKKTLPFLLSSSSPEVRSFGKWLMKHDPASIALLIQTLHRIEKLPLNKDFSGAPYEALKRLDINDLSKSTAYEFHAKYYKK